jgi:hypothetical protein
MADGLFYVDTRPPFLSADVAQVTLSTTYKAMIPAANIPVLGGNYFGAVGKGMRIRLFGRISTITTPGNGQIAMFYGTGADANGVNLAQSAVFALTASQTNLTWEALFTVRCRTMGATGTLFCTGEFNANPGVVASSLQPILIPASAPVASGSCDLTASLLLSPQFLRSGSTAEVLTVHEVCYESLN